MPGQIVVRLMDGERRLWDDSGTCVDDLDPEAAAIVW